MYIKCLFNEIKSLYSRRFRLIDIMITFSFFFYVCFERKFKGIEYSYKEEKRKKKNINIIIPLCVPI